MFLVWCVRSLEEKISPVIGEITYVVAASTTAIERLQLGPHTTTTWPRDVRVVDKTISSLSTISGSQLIDNIIPKVMDTCMQCMISLG